jgi:serine/threonine-protein kinase
VEDLDGEPLLVMDYVEGAPLSALITGPTPAPPSVIVRVILDVCSGLQAAHDLTDETGRRMSLVHRDVSPHNILVGLDGIARIADFGVAKDACALSSPGTRTGVLKGKAAYMAPEYVLGQGLNPCGDIFGLGVVLWEGLTAQKLFRRATELETLQAVVAAQVPAPSTLVPGLEAALDAVALRAVAKSPLERFESAQELSDALEAAATSAGLVAPRSAVAKLVAESVGSVLAARRALIQSHLAKPETVADGALDGAEATRNAHAVPLERSDLRTLTMEGANPEAPARAQSGTAPLKRLRGRAAAAGFTIALGVFGIAALRYVVTGSPAQAIVARRAETSAAPMPATPSSSAEPSALPAPPDSTDTAPRTTQAKHDVSAPVRRPAPPARRPASSAKTTATSNKPTVNDYDKAAPNPYGAD